MNINKFIILLQRTAMTAGTRSSVQIILTLFILFYPFGEWCPGTGVRVKRTDGDPENSEPHVITMIDIFLQ